MALLTLRIGTPDNTAISIVMLATIIVAMNICCDASVLLEDVMRILLLE